MTIDGINEYFKQKRIENGISAQQVADIVGVSRRTICYWESGKRGITLEHADKLLNALGYRIEIVAKDGEKKE